MDNSPSVSVDEQVNYSDLIGYVGKEGAGSTGYHLHIDVNTIGAYYGGDSSNNVNYDTTIISTYRFHILTGGAKNEKHIKKHSCVMRSELIIMLIKCLWQHTGQRTLGEEPICCFNS